MSTKELPILFSAPMVRAILEGRKTQTRRVMKQQPEHRWNLLRVDESGASFCTGNHERSQGCSGDVVMACPYGKPGDRLWVRETWRVEAWSDIDNNLQIGYAAGGNWDRSDVIPAQYDPDGEMFCKLAAQSEEDAIKRGFDPADGDIDAQSWTWSEKEIPTRWRPSIHMPRWASRITLEVTGMRVQRLQDISEGDAFAEGMNSGSLEIWKSGDDTPIGMFGQLWDSINDARGLGWDTNPWVWVVEFRRVTPSQNVTVR